MKNKTDIYQCDQCKHKFIAVGDCWGSAVCLPCINREERYFLFKHIFTLITIIICAIGGIYISYQILGWGIYPAIVLAYIIYRVFAHFRGAAL